jgi:epoxide hydrolase A/B
MKPREGRRSFLWQLTSGTIAGHSGTAAWLRQVLHQKRDPVWDRVQMEDHASHPTSTQVRHRRIRTNGITMHIAEAGTGFPVVLLHGFPELWYSWRHQLPALADAGYHAIAPDLRGYGETDAPQSVASYSMRNMTADVTGVLDAMGVPQAVVVGHDWGANIGWACAELYPQRVVALVVLGIPYHPRPQTPPTEMIAQFAGDHFSFVQYFQQAGVAEAELERDVRDSLRRFFFALSGDAPPGVVPYLFTAKPASAGVLGGMPTPTTPPRWLTDADLDYYVDAYQRTGFRGALNRYRNMDRDWTDLPDVGASGVKGPTLFLGGRGDSAVIFGTFDPMIRATPDLQRITFVRNCGHWIQQERPSEVNTEIIAFLKRNVE